MTASFLKTGGINGTIIGTTDVSDGIKKNIKLEYSKDYAAIKINNVQEGNVLTSLTPPIPSTQLLELGTTSDGIFPFGTIKNVRIYPKRNVGYKK